MANPRDKTEFERQLHAAGKIAEANGFMGAVLKGYEVLVSRPHLSGRELVDVLKAEGESRWAMVVEGAKDAA